MSDAVRLDRGGASAFFREHEEALRQTRQIGPTLDLACGRGRHALAAAGLGLSVLAVDRNQELLDELSKQEAGTRDTRPGRIETRRVDLESAAPPALDANRFGSVLVFRYLHRPLCPWIESRIAPGGLLLYETFMRDQRELGWGPRKDAYLLEPGELPALFPGLRVEVFEEGPSGDAKPARTARLLARRPV